MKYVFKNSDIVGGILRNIPNSLDVSVFEQVNAAIEGRHAVIHTASPPHGLSPSLYEKVNVV